MKKLYATTVTVTGGREGRALSSDGLLDVALSMPKEIGGAGTATNPEQLFAAGFAACFNSSIRFVARGRGLDAGDVSSAATVTLLLADDGAYGIAARLDVTVPGLYGAELDSVLVEAKRACAYSNALRGTADVTINLV
jgi:Ohr subfamily peroxiredoxin